MLKKLSVVMVIFLLLFAVIACQRITVLIKEPKDGAVVTTSRINVTGSVTIPKAKITVNNVAVTVGKGGFFTASVQLSPGKNVITVVGTLGEQTYTKLVTVTYTP